jgi:parallel beta-helix repeat protein
MRSRTVALASRCLHLLLTGLLLAPAVQAQYTTPNTGQAYTLDDLVAISGGVFTTTSAANYLQNADFTLAVTDTLLIDADLLWAVDGAASIDIAGAFIATPPVQAVITAADEDQHHQGIRFEEGSHVDLQRMSITYGGGIKCLTDDLVLSYCLLSDQVSNATTGAALELPSGKVTIDHVVFQGNEHAAISSAANGEAAPQITHCTFLQNGFANTNRPQINLGPSGADTTLIRDNVVIGDPANTQVGGIAFSSLLGVEGHAVIDSNQVVGNRYGIAVTGSTITSLLTNNIITDNNTQGDPLLGGSGINLNGGSTNVSMGSGNQISGNLWGVTLQGAAMANFGDTAVATFNPGGNSFANNGNGGVTYALYNNTPNPLPAMNNCWDFESPLADSASVAVVIFDSADDGSLGEVFFMPFSCNFTTGVGQAGPSTDPLTIYPNPAHGQVTIRSERPLERYALYNASGRLVRAGQWPMARPLVMDGLSAGLYLMKAEGRGVAYGRKIVVE